MIICHLTSIHPRYDNRIFHKQCISSLKTFNIVYQIVCDGNGNEKINNVKIIDLGKIKNLFDRIIFKQLKMLILMIRLKPNLIQIHDPELILLGYFLSFKHKVVYDSHENILDQIEHKERLIISKRIAKPIIELILSKILPRLNAVIGATEEIIGKLKNHNKLVIYNWPILKEFQSTIEFQNRNTSQICYIGALTEARGIYTLVEAIHQIKDVHLILGGVFSNKKFFDKCRSHPGWKKVTYHGWINRAEVDEILKNSVVGISLLDLNPAYKNGITTKILEYMATGIPFISSRTIFCENLVSNYKCGKIVNNNTEELAEAINYYLINIEKAEEHGKNGRLAVQQSYSWEKEEIKLNQFYKKILYA